MLRIAKLTDYATLLMTHLACDADACLSAAQLAASLRLPLPTVTKLLKQLLRAQLLVSVRGTAGGYSLAHAPRAISLAAVFSAIEGPLALTDCERGHGRCSLERGCMTRANWQVINRAVETALSAVSLADMATPLQHTVQLHRLPHQERPS
jgi:FeS assembly SUF system regulator